MGLIEQIAANQNKNFSRTFTTLTTGLNGVGSGSTALLGGGYVLLGASANSSPCRIRLYNDSASLDLDRTRTQTDFNISDSVGLVADIVLTDLGELKLTPPILSFPLTNGATWYNISSSAGTQTTVTLEAYPFLQQGDSITDKQELRIVTEKISTSGYGESGSLTTPKAFTILTGSAFRNIGLDPNFRNGSTSDCDGWEFLIDSKSVADLTAADGVTQPFPGSANYIAAKIATRTSQYQLSCAQQVIAVNVGDTYRVSGYVYGGNNTLGGYAVGYFVQTLDSGTNPIAITNIKTSTNPVGWYYLQGEVTIASGVSYIQVGPFIDGPYPNGYGYGDPTCSAAYNLNPTACPGFTWFAGLSVINVSEGEVNGLSSRVKLFSTPLNEVPTTEFTRSFSSIPDDSSKLIVDFAFDSSSRQYKLTPVLEAYTWSGSNYTTGTGKLSYQIQNTSTGGSYTNESFLVTLLTHKIEN